MFEMRIEAEPTAPVLVTAFEGWVSAGSVGTTAADHMAEGGDVIATFPPDRLFDFRVSRPTATFRDGALREIEWPGISVRHRTVEGRDLLVLSGPEPNWNWPEFAASVAELAERLGVVAQITPWNAPLFTCCWQVAPAICAGNAVMIKPSELTPLTSVVIGILCGSVVAKMNLACSGGSSRVFNNALKALVESI